MQLNGYPLNAIDKTIEKTLQINYPEYKSKEMEPLNMFTPYDKAIA